MLVVNYANFALPALMKADNDVVKFSNVKQ